MVAIHAALGMMWRMKKNGRAEKPIPQVKGVTPDQLIAAALRIPADAPKKAKVKPGKK